MILFPSDACTEIPEDIVSHFLTIKTMEVAKFQPRTRSEFEASNKFWPTLFRPTEIDKERERGLTEIECSFASRIMAEVYKDCSEVYHIFETSNKQILPHNSGGVIINPLNNKVCLL